MGVASSVTAMVEKPFFSLSASTSASVSSGVRFEALTTKPALWFLTRRTMAAWLSTGWEPKMKDRPPSFASATAIVSFETDCMIAEVIGMFRQRGHSSSPLRNFTRGVRRDTFSGRQFSGVRPGMSRYSLKVRDGSL